MRILTKFTQVALVATLCCTFACTQTEQRPQDEIPPEVLAKIKTMGFSTEGVLKADDGYIVERDIFIPVERLGEQYENPLVLRAGQEEQYRTTNVVNTNGGRVVTIYLDTRFNSNYQTALQGAIGAYNNLNLDLSFQQTNNESGADIRITRLNRFLELFGVLGSAGFPTASGDPFNRIQLSGVMESSFGYSIGAIATVIGHEIGHCIGFRHTDYFDRSISCGGATDPEPAAPEGAILIPGTPSGANLADASWMLACSDGSTRRFNADDITALNWMYKDNF
ncbi:protease B [marine bacterium AO1-C]|nr:protease B [marine bacterium AO1-C]